MNNIIVSDTSDEQLGSFFKICADLILCEYSEIFQHVSDKNVNSISLGLVLERCKDQFDLAVFYCHGDIDAFLGVDGEKILDVNSDNLIKLEHSIVYSFSCDSGRILGPRLVEIGCRAFIGYSDEVSILSNLQSEFANCVHAGVEQILVGSSVEVAKLSIIHRYKQLMNDVDFFAKSIINNNIDRLVLIGNPESVVK